RHSGYGWRNRDASRGSPSGSASTRRPPAIASHACESCSGTRWTIRTSGSGWSWHCGSEISSSAASRRRVRRQLGLGRGLGSEWDLGAERPCRNLVVPDVDDWDLEMAGVATAELDHLRTVPVAVPVGLGLEPRHLRDAVAVILGAMHGVLGRAI